MHTRALTHPATFQLTMSIKNVKVFPPYLRARKGPESVKQVRDGRWSEEVPDGIS
jgi:hypothetical protein